MAHDRTRVRLMLFFLFLILILFCFFLLVLVDVVADNSFLLLLLSYLPFFAKQLANNTSINTTRYNLCQYVLLPVRGGIADACHGGRRIRFDGEEDLHS